MSRAVYSMQLINLVLTTSIFLPVSLSAPTDLPLPGFCAPTKNFYDPATGEDPISLVPRGGEPISRYPPYDIPGSNPPIRLIFDRVPRTAQGYSRKTVQALCDEAIIDLDGKPPTQPMPLGCSMTWKLGLFEFWLFRVKLVAPFTHGTADAAVKGFRQWMDDKDPVRDTGGITIYVGGQLEGMMQLRRIPLLTGGRIA
ncbi:MAG: hypothetical protein Q9164_003796 [Protoblastenia rupestris]